MQVMDGWGVGSSELLLCVDHKTGLGLWPTRIYFIVPSVIQLSYLL